MCIAKPRPILSEWLGDDVSKKDPCICFFLIQQGPYAMTSDNFLIAGINDTFSNDGSSDSSISRAAHDWTSTGKISTTGRWFKDEYGRICLMRGVNLCGSSKIPTSPPGSTHLSEKFYDHHNVSFVGRPFPPFPEDIDEHFGRLRAWGLTFVRLLVTWESLEHAGPGIYDEEYIDCLISIISAMPRYGIKCFIDPHQDAWSRFSGGSGAPGWTFEVAGFDIKSFKETGAAYVHNVNHQPGDHQPMVWPTNYTKLASSTMFTLFWAGDVFAPNTRWQGKSIQQTLQDRYLDCYKHLAERLKHLEAVIGYEVMNEPHPGYIGLLNFQRYDSVMNLVFGDSPCALQSMALGDGIPQLIDVYVKSWPYPTRLSHSRWINTEKKSAWLPGRGGCLWRQHGVWDVANDGSPYVLKEDYFLRHPKSNDKINFYTDFYLPFVKKFGRTLQEVAPETMIFVGPVPNEDPPIFTPEDHHNRVIFAPHWYDLNSLFYKSFDSRWTHDVQALQQGTKNVLAATYFGIEGAKRNYSGQIANIVQRGLQFVGEKPIVIGEVGIPMDINDKRAFVTGDFSHHSNYLDALLSSLEENLVNFTLWNYNPMNDNIYGDHWNGEDFSIYSSSRPGYPKKADFTAPLNLVGFEQEEDLESEFHVGGRVLNALLRPYAAKVDGVPLRNHFNVKTLKFTFEFMSFDSDSQQGIETEIFIPNYHYGKEVLNIRISDGEFKYLKEKQTLFYRHSNRGLGEFHVVSFGIVKKNTKLCPCSII